MNDTGADDAIDAAEPAPLAEGELELSVILPVYNGADGIRGQLDQLLCQEWDRPWEIVVVDNDSTDDTPRILADYQQHHPDRLRVVAAPREHNLSYVRNVGVREARGRAVVFCDDDDLVGDRWVPVMGEALRHHPLVGSQMEYHRLNDDRALDGRADFQSQGIETVFGLPVVNGVSGVQRDLWDRLGGNDEQLHLASEDFDFALRAHLEAGVTPHFAEGALYHVRRRTGLKPTFRQARRYGRSAAVLYQRYARPRGVEPVRWKSVIVAWAWIIWNAPDAFRPDRQTRWAWRAGMRLGRIEGSLRARVLYL